MQWINDNGTLRPADAGVHSAGSPVALYGDGLFETIRYEGGILFLWERHWARLWEGCQCLLMPLSIEWTPDFFEQEVRRTIAANAAGSCRVRLQVYAATAGGADDTSIRYAISCGALPSKSAADAAGLRLGIATAAVKNRGPLSHLKTCSALPYRVAAREAEGHGWDDTVLLSSSGAVVETTKCNIFWAKGGTVFVVPVAEGCVAGVMRAQVMEWLPQWGFPVVESSLELSSLLCADEVFLTNAIRRVQIVAKINDRSYGSPLSRHIAEMVERKFIPPPQPFI